MWEAISLAGRIEARTARAVLPVVWKEVAAAFDDPEIWCAVASVAGALLAKGRLTGEEADAILARGLSHAPRPKWVKDQTE